MKFLVNEAIDILYCDEQLSYNYLSALEQRLQDYFTQQLRVSRKRGSEYIFLGKGIGLLNKDLEDHRYYTLIGKYSVDRNLLYRFWKSSCRITNR